VNASRFLVDVISTGTLLGLGPGSAPQEVGAVLGEEFGENRSAGLLWRDYGLAEFVWERQDTGQPWRGRHFVVQAHRLNTISPQGPDLVGPALRAVYGTFMPVMLPGIDVIAASLAAEGWPLREIRAADPEAREYWQPDSGVTVVTTSAEARGPELIHKIFAGLPANHLDPSAPVPERSSTAERLRYLRGLPAPERLRWIERHRPTHAASRPNWWLMHLQGVDGFLYRQPAQLAQWVELKLWLIEQSQTDGTFTAHDTALRRAQFIGELHIRCVPLPPVAGLPTADELVRACLDAIPGSPNDLPRATDLHRLTHSEMQCSRRAKNLISAAEPHGERVRDPDLAERLRRCSELKPHLV
jgi:hypothetical protein